MSESGTPGGSTPQQPNPPRHAWSPEAAPDDEQRAEQSGQHAEQGGTSGPTAAQRSAGAPGQPHGEAPGQPWGQVRSQPSGQARNQPSGQVLGQQPGRPQVPSGGELPVRRTTPPPAEPTVTPRVGGTSAGAPAARTPGGMPGGAPGGTGGMPGGAPGGTGGAPGGVPAGIGGAPDGAPGGTGGTPAGTALGVAGSAAGGPGDASDERARPAWVLPVSIGAGVLVVAGVVTGVLLANRDDATPPPEPIAAETIYLPSPTPSIEPVARDATTPFASVLPASVLQYALQSSAEDGTWTDAGALEAYTDELGDGGAGTVTVQSGQWATVDEAMAFRDALVADLPADATAGGGSGRDALPQSGPVEVAGEHAGTFTAVDLGNGTGVVVWNNETAVLRVQGPVADVLDVYRAFPL